VHSFSVFLQERKKKYKEKEKKNIEKLKFLHCKIQCMLQLKSVDCNSQISESEKTKNRFDKLYTF